MDISLTPELERFVSSCVNSGRYQSATEVVEEGLRMLEECILLMDRVAEYDSAVEGVRQKIAVGLEQARRGELLDGEEVFRELEEQASAPVASP